MNAASKTRQKKHWYYLTKGEVIQKGDYYQQPSKKWVLSGIAGDKVDADSVGFYRREVKESRSGLPNQISNPELPQLGTDY